MKINQISRFSEKPEDEAAVISNWLAMISCHQTGHVNPVLTPTQKYILLFMAQLHLAIEKHFEGYSESWLPSRIQDSFI